MIPTEGRFTSQETLQATFQLRTPMSIKEPIKHPVTWPTLSQRNLNLGPAQKELL